MNYKNYIKSQEIRFRILSILKFIPDSIAIRLQYYIKTSRLPNLNNPKRFTEKIQYYKLFYNKPLLTKCADKYLVRDYIKSKRLQNILNDLYGVYNNADDIPFELLPNKFIIKTTNGSGMNLICKDKSNLNFTKVRKQLDYWLSIDMYSLGREWCYKNIKPKIIIERLLEDSDNPFNGINDYKFLCFNGQAKYVWLDVDRQESHKRNFYDLDWNYIDIESDHPSFGDCVEKPKNLDMMIKIANRLSSKFPFVRVDLYSIKSKIYFGELTFYPCTGYLSFKPDDFDYKLGEEFDFGPNNL